MKNLIWAEKYRPKHLRQLILPPKSMMAFKQFIHDKQIPHLLFYGPPGSGKTTLAMILLREVAAGKLILNASSGDRGIATIKFKVKQFAGTQRSHPEKLNVVFFDESDGMTSDAQLALKNTIEKYHQNCRFIFTCNQIEKVIDPIISRCMIFEFSSMPQDQLIRLLESILKKEKVKYNIKDIKKIIKIHYPDIRTILNVLQAGSIGGTLDIVDTMTDLHMVERYLLKGQIAQLRQSWKNKVDFIWVFKYLFDVFIPKHMKNDVKTEASVVTAEYLYRNRSIVDKEINVAACCLEIMNLLDVDIDFINKK